jgi:hypothetical protein
MKNIGGPEILIQERKEIKMKKEKLKESQKEIDCCKETLGKIRIRRIEENDKNRSPYCTNNSINQS